MTAGYSRVSKKSPCLICGKPDWCSTTADRKISFCARSSGDADRVSSDGWGIYYNRTEYRRNPNCGMPPKSKLRAERIQIATIDLRNKIYQKLLQLSPWALGNHYISSDECTNSRVRDFSSRYGLLPKAVFDRTRLARSLIEAFARDSAGVLEFYAVPGFWRGSDGRLRLGSEFDSVDDLLLIPFYDRNGFVQACQIRIMRRSSKTSGKYLWLSSKGRHEGSGPGTPLHHEGAVYYMGRAAETVLVTEGAIKAATAQTFLADRYVVANSGVATSHEEIIKTARKKNLEIAFDADCFTNPHVAKAIASLIFLRVREQQFLSYDRPIRIITWDRRFKGIDDALLAGATLKYLEVQEWLSSLTPDCFEAARHQLSGISL